MDIEILTKASVTRLPHFKNKQGKLAHVHPDGSDWTVLEWAGAMCGEAGEAANQAKKIRRGDYEGDELNGNYRLGEELADTICYAVLVAARQGIDLSAAIVGKFNKVSKEIGSDVVLVQNEFDNGIKSSSFIFKEAEKKSSQAWYEEAKKYVFIKDPDGWDRKNWQHSWHEEKITKKEFCKRVALSTTSMHDDWGGLRAWAEI